jgi:hypothetical protein
MAEEYLLTQSQIALLQSQIALLIHVFQLLTLLSQPDPPLG